MFFKIGKTIFVLGFWSALAANVVVEIVGIRESLDRGIVIPGSIISKLIFSLISLCAFFLPFFLVGGGIMFVAWVIKVTKGGSLSHLISPKVDGAAHTNIAGKLFVTIATTIAAMFINFFVGLKFLMHSPTLAVFASLFFPANKPIIKEPYLWMPPFVDIYILALIFLVFPWFILLASIKKVVGVIKMRRSQVICNRI